MAVEFSKDCDKDQGFDFKQDEHKTFGYINTLVIGDVEIAPDIKVVEATASSGIKIKAGGAGGGTWGRSDRGARAADPNHREAVYADRPACPASRRPPGKPRRGQRPRAFTVQCCRGATGTA